MKLTGRMRPRDDYDAEPHEAEVEAETHAEALAEMQASVPDGWVLLSVQ